MMIPKPAFQLGSEHTLVLVLDLCGTSRSRSAARPRACASASTCSGRWYWRSRLRPGFGRFGQVASQSLLAGGMDVSIILLFGRRALELLGVNVLAAQTVSDIRTRDAERFALEVSSNDDRAGMDKLLQNREGARVDPVPFVEPERQAP